MRGIDELRERLERIDGRGYGAYKELRGRWAVGDWTLDVAWVQGDPYAHPSRLRALLDPEVANLPPELLSSRSRRVGLACHLARAFDRAADGARSSRGSGRSGDVLIYAPGQEVLEQTAVQVGADGAVEARFYVGLPARGRRILGRQASELLAEDVAGAVEGSLRAAAHDPDALRRAAEVNEDADHLRDRLPDLGLVAFVADGAVLPRRSGVDDRPMRGDGVVPFESPEPLRVEVTLPNRGTVSGMGLRPGVTLVVGGGFHGKSTLLRALEQGVYNHRPGDGRERVVADPGSVKIRSEDGRAVAGVDISAFIDGLPFDADTRAFTTPNASGSTSQAAIIAEALEAGATTLLVDEDTAATNFMIRDRRMQALVPKADEPITPFVDRVRDLFEELGVSSVLVLGGSGDYLEVADTVIVMRDYRPLDATERAREVARDLPTGRAPESGHPLGARPSRIPLPDSIDLRRGKRPVSVKVRSRQRIEVGRVDVDLSAVEQLVSRSQVRALAEALALARLRFVDGGRTLSAILDAVEDAVRNEGLDVLDERGSGDLAAFRRFELAAALSRLRTLETRPGPAAPPSPREP
ncbi:MAG: ABC-ATPase domain-containing protein [Gemmatimonadota bacterium]|jgi:predicted ABC-class ATPase